MKNKLLTILFIGFLFTFFGLNLLTKDKDVSSSERRYLAKLPELTINNALNSKIADQFENYATDQFVFRDTFRSLKVTGILNLLGMSDYNNYYTDDGYIFKMDSFLNEKNVSNFIKKMNAICDKTTKDNSIYLGIIPDKIYYDKSNSLNYNQNHLVELVKDGISKQVTYIDLTDSISLEDYYYSDIHLKQNCLGNIMTKLENTMHYVADSPLEEHSLSPFYGSFYGSIGKYLDEIVYLSNDIIDNSVVSDYEKGIRKVYELSDFNHMDGYDVFLGGPSPLLEIINPSYNGTRELVIFRDSFASSIAPLMIEGYSKITMIDLRYMAQSLIDDYLEFTNQDILILYSTSVINHSEVLK